MLVRFLAKRVAVLAVVAACAALVTDGLRPALPLGIMLGGFFGVYKTRLDSMALAGTLNGDSPFKSTLTQLCSRAFVLALLVVAALADLRLFAGLAAGLLLLPLFICANAFTEYVGLSHNAWGEAKRAQRR